ncbi:MAG: nucleotidyltransferase family protein [Pseudomonadota bacterium]
MADETAVAGVLLAAGRAKRMAGASKVLALFEGEPLVRRQAKRLIASLCDKVVVVTGHEHQRVADVLAELTVHIIHNDDYLQGMGTSIAAGAGALEDKALLLTFADMPELTTDHFNTIIQSWNGKNIVRGADGDKPGHPILFPAFHLNDLRALQGDFGAKNLVRDATLVDIGVAATLDVDTPEAVRRAGGEPG